MCTPSLCIRRWKQDFTEIIVVNPARVRALKVPQDRCQELWLAGCWIAAAVSVSRVRCSHGLPGDRGPGGPTVGARRSRVAGGGDPEACRSTKVIGGRAVGADTAGLGVDRHGVLPVTGDCWPAGRDRPWPVRGGSWPAATRMPGRPANLRHPADTATACLPTPQQMPPRHTPDAGWPPPGRIVLFCSGC